MQLILVPNKTIVLVTLPAIQTHHLLTHVTFCQTEICIDHFAPIDSQHSRGPRTPAVVMDIVTLSLYMQQSRCA